MTDARYDQLAGVLTRHSTALRPGDKVLVEVSDVPDAMVRNLIRQVREQAGGEGEEEMITIAPSISVGDEVEVATGPFQGMKGIIRSVAPATERVKVLLEFLGQIQPVDLDLFSILTPSKPIPNF